jgi:hypothetical protein
MQRITVQVAIQPGVYMIAWLVQLVPHLPRSAIGAFYGMPDNLITYASAYFKLNKFPEKGTPVKSIWKKIFRAG